MPGGSRPNSDPSRAAAVEESRTERVKASDRRLAQPRDEPRHVIEVRGKHRRSRFIHERRLAAQMAAARPSQTNKRGKRTSSTELQRTVADQLIRLVRLDCPDDCGRAAATELSLAQ